MENDNLLIGVSQAIRLRNRDNKTYILSTFCLAVHVGRSTGPGFIASRYCQKAMPYRKYENWYCLYRGTTVTNSRSSFCRLPDCPSIRLRGS
jgi:hypothetical protein